MLLKWRCMYIHPPLKARRLRVLLMHIVYKVHVQGVITNRLQVALFYQSVFVVGCWATKLKIRLVPQKEKLGANVVCHFGRVCKSSLNLNAKKSHSSVYFMTAEYSNELYNPEDRASSKQALERQESLCKTTW